MNLKRNWILFPVVLLVLAGMVLLGCPDGGGGGGDDGDYVITALTLVPGEDDNPTAGKITGAQFNSVKSAKLGSFLRITVDTSNNTYTDPNAGPGWGIGAVGNFTDDDGKVDGDKNLGFAWPPAGTAYADVPLSQAIRYMETGDDFLYVNIWQGCTIVKIELYAKKVADTEPALGEGVIALIGVPSGEAANPGKGTIGYVDYMLIINSDDECVLKFYCTGSGNIGTIGKDWGGNPNTPPVVSIVPATGIFKMTVAQLKATGITTTKAIIINVWGNAAITKIELCEAPEGEVPEYEVSLEVNGSYGHQGIMNGFFTSQNAAEDDTYTLDIEFTSDQDISWLSISVVDNGQPDYPWNVISDSTGISDITANEKKTASVTITITADPTTDAQHLVLETGADVLSEPALLQIWSITVTKND